jgi:hypothetical protein
MKTPLIFLMALVACAAKSAEPAVPENAGEPPPAPSGFSWEVVPGLTDEFTGAALDETKWMPRCPYWNGREPSRFDPANVTVRDGLLRLRSTTQAVSLDGIKNPEKDVWVQSACVASLKPSAVCGFYAARLKASKISMTSSFWFQGKYSEIDVVEQVGGSIKNPANGMLMLMNTHYFSDGWAKDKATPKSWKMPAGAADTFHVYGVWWKDENTVWMYHDGVKVAELVRSSRMSDWPASLNGVGGRWLVRVWAHRNRRGRVVVQSQVASSSDGAPSVADWS